MVHRDRDKSRERKRTKRVGKGRKKNEAFFHYPGKEERKRERGGEGNETNKLPNKLRKRLASIRRRGTRQKKKRSPIK